MNTTTPPTPRQRSIAPRGFTLIELLIVIAVIAILAGMLLPALSKAKGMGQKAGCLSNLKQLHLSWYLYTEDHQDVMVHNRVRFTFSQWQMEPGSWVVGNTAQVPDGIGITNGALFRYGPAVGIYRCPGDNTFMRDPAIPQLRPLSYAMNGYLNGSINGIRMQKYDFDGRQFGVTKSTEIRRPLETLLLGGTANRLQGNAGCYYQNPDPNENWVTKVADHHNQGINHAFTDGHVEYWKWCYAPKDFSNRRAGANAEGAPVPVANDCDLKDLRRVQRGLIPN